MSTVNENVVVCDNGTGFVKCGFAGENFPRHMFPSMVGRPTLRAEEDAIGDVEIKDIMCGDEAAAVRQALEIRYPVDCGIIRHWDDMEALWDYTFYEKLKIKPDEKKMMLTEAPLNPKKNREKTVEIIGKGIMNVYGGLVDFADRTTKGKPSKLSQDNSIVSINEERNK